MSSKWVAATILVVSAASLLGAQPALATNMPATTWIPASSNNYTPGRSGKIDMVVIHKAEGSTVSAAYTFQNPGRQASAHYSVGDGIVYSMVHEHDTAWHAGNWAVNVRSIGIENGGFTYRDDFTEGHYRTLALLVANICERYGIPEDRHHIIGHSEVPDPNHPGEFGGADHHTDPGPYFDWSHFMDLVHQFSHQGGATPPPPPPSQPAPPSNPGEHGCTVSASVLNVRDAAWGNVLGQVSMGNGWVRTGRANQGFAEIYFRGGRAWVYAAYTTAASFTGARVDISALNVRSGPGTSNSVVGQVHAGQTYAQIQEQGGWRLIRYDQDRRWIYAGYSTALPIHS